MRRKDREMGRETALAVLDKCEWAVLAMVDGAGLPYCLPITIVRDGETLYFHGALSGEKAQCLRARPRVCLTAVGDTRIVQEKFTTEYESAVVRGRVEEITGPAAKLEALRLLCLHHCPDGMGGFEAEAGASLRRTGVWALHMENITAKRKKYGPDGKEEKSTGN